jgi:hypothetical protein
MRVNRTITVNAGTPVNLGTGLTTAVPQNTPPIWVSRWIAQMLIGGSGYGIIYDGVGLGRLPNAAGNAQPDVTAQLNPATATATGGSIEDWDKSHDRIGINVLEIWIDGSHTGDLIAASFVPET